MIFDLWSKYSSSHSLTNTYLCVYTVFVALKVLLRFFVKKDSSCDSNWILQWFGCIYSSVYTYWKISPEKFSNKKICFYMYAWFSFRFWPMETWFCLLFELKITTKKFMLKPTDVWLLTPLGKFNQEMSTFEQVQQSIFFTIQGLR